MHIYMAAVYTNGYRHGGNPGRYQKLNEHEKVLCDSVPHVLESYHYIGKDRFVNAIKEDNAKVFLDSGAFSALSLNVTITVEEYCNYIYKNFDILRCEDGAWMASVLDGIGDAHLTRKNQQEMEDRLPGFKPMPCFHMGEPEEYLKEYVAKYPYITLGGLVGASTKQLMTWLDRIWDRFLVDGAGNPLCKVHGFGITAVPIMEAYPWYSCDSSSWIQTAAFGGITTPYWSNIAVSEKSPYRHDAGQHAVTLTQLEQDVLFEHLEKNGFTYERLSSVYESRAAYNLWAFGVINAMINAAHSNKFKSRVQELF